MCTVASTLESRLAIISALALNLHPFSCFCTLSRALGLVVHAPLNGLPSFIATTDTMAAVGVQLLQGRPLRVRALLHA